MIIIYSYYSSIYIFLRANLKFHLLGVDEVSEFATTHRIEWIPFEELNTIQNDSLEFGVAEIMTVFYNDMVRISCCL